MRRLCAVGRAGLDRRGRDRICTGPRHPIRAECNRVRAMRLEERPSGWEEREREGVDPGRRRRAYKASGGPERVHSSRDSGRRRRQQQEKRILRVAAQPLRTGETQTQCDRQTDDEDCERRQREGTATTRMRTRRRGGCDSGKCGACRFFSKTTRPQRQIGEDGDAAGGRARRCRSDGMRGGLRRREGRAVMRRRK